MLWAAFLNHAFVTDRMIAIVVIAFLAISVGAVGWLLSSTPVESRKPLLWFLPLLPLLFLGVAMVLGLVLFAQTILWPILACYAIRRENRYRNGLRSKGRLIMLDELEARLDIGMGTLILEWGEKGAYRVWWTEDDLKSLGRPASTKDDIEAALQGQHPFNTQCQKEYLDEETGKAFLTSIPARYARSGRLAGMFPRMKTAIVYRRFVSP